LAELLKGSTGPEKDLRGLFFDYREPFFREIGLGAIKVQKVLEIGIDEDLFHNKVLVIIADDGVIYRVPLERFDQLTDDALSKLKTKIVPKKEVKR
jgi:hypothetical protein